MSLPHGVDDELREVPASEWLASIQQALDEGHHFFDWLGCVDEIGRSDEFRVVLRLVDFGAESPHGLRLQVRVPRQEPSLPTCTDLLPGAAWHEREVRDFFGVCFEGGDQAPLLNHPAAGSERVPFLRKDIVLAARAAQPWPGAKEPGEGAGAPSRRRMAPPGVPDPAVWGDRDPATEEPTSEELAQAVSGGRVRRRR